MPPDIEPEQSSNRPNSSDKYDICVDILKAIANLSSVLLINEDLDYGVNEALKILGTSIEAERLYLHKHYDDPAEETPGYVATQYEWISDDKYQIYHSILNRISDDGIENCYGLMVEGEYWGGLIDSMPEPFRSGQLKLGVKAAYAIPIVVKGQYWGIMALDFCKVARELEESEIAVLKIAATCLRGAIERERNRCAEEEAKKAAGEKTVDSSNNNQILSLPDRWLEATANAATKLLQIADLNEAMNAALKVLGESLDCDRVNIMEHFPSSSNESYEYVCILYEWHSSHTIPQISHPRLNRVSAEGIEDWFVTLKGGGWVGGVINELREPFRSGQTELGVKTTYSVPIFIDRAYWGAICVDFCRQPRHLTSAELAVFKTAASCIGSAMYRQQIQQDKEQAELAVLNERNRMAREIHDTLAQAFTGISLQLEAAINILSTQPEAAQKRLLQAKALAKEGITEARRSVRALRPETLEFNNLAIALQQLMNNMTNGTGIKTQIIIEGEPELASDLEVDLYRIAQEAITNTLRHAQASELTICLMCQTDLVELQIKDDGIGFEPNLVLNNSFGLIGMQERCDRHNGNLLISSDRHRGTEITITIAL